MIASAICGLKYFESVSWPPNARNGNGTENHCRLPIPKLPRSGIRRKMVNYVPRTSRQAAEFAFGGSAKQRMTTNGKHRYIKEPKDMDVPIAVAFA